MRAEHFKKFERKITAAIKTHLANGGELRAGSFGRGTCLCPITCLVGCPGDWNGFTNTTTWWYMVSKTCGVPFSQNDMWQFIYGFDSDIEKPQSRAKLHLLGRKLRAKYLPING
jgi:hypothetical protein